MAFLLAFVVVLIVSFVIRHWIPITLFLIAATVYHNVAFPHGNISVDAYMSHKTVDDFDDDMPLEWIEGSKLKVFVFNSTDNLIITRVKVVCEHGTSASWNLTMKPGDTEELMKLFKGHAADRNGENCATTYDTKPAQPKHV